MARLCCCLRTNSCGGPSVAGVSAVEAFLLLKGLSRDIEIKYLTK